MNNTTLELSALVADLNRIEENARCGWINCLDPESLSIVKTAVEVWNEYCISNGWNDENCLLDFESYGCEKIWVLQLLAESLEEII